MEVRGVAADQRKGDDQEQGPRRHLDDDENGVEGRAFLRSDDQQCGHEGDDEAGPKAEDTPDFAALEEAPLDWRPYGECVRYVYPDGIQKPGDESGPADRDRA